MNMNNEHKHEQWLQTTQPTSDGAVTADTSCCANCVEPSRPQQWGTDLQFLGMPVMRTTGWLALLLTKAGDVKTNPGPTTLNKRVWICDVIKHISIRCNRIEHWVHFRCAGIRQAQYTNTWTCHLHRKSRLTPPHRYRPWSKTPTHSPPTPRTPPQPKHRHTSNTPPVPTGLVKPNYLFHSPPPSNHTAPRQTHKHVIHFTNTSHYTHLKHVTCTRKNTLTTCTTHTRTHRNHTSPRLHTSIAVTLAPSHSHSTHTCNTNNSTCLPVAATTALTTQGTTTTSQTDQ